MDLTRSPVQLTPRPPSGWHSAELPGLRPLRFFRVPHTAAGRAAVVLAGTLAVATLTQALFWRTGLGLNFFLWTLLSVGACLGSIRPTRLTAIGSFAIASAALLGFSVVRFAGAWAVAIAVPSVLVVLAVLPLALRDQVDLTDAARLPLDTARTLVGTRRAAREAWRIPGAALGGRHGMLAGALKGLFVGLPVTGVFVLLLRSDADFASALARIADRIGEVAAFTGWTLVTAAAGLFTHMLYAALTSRIAASPLPSRPPQYRPHGSSCRRYSPRPGSWSSDRSPSSSRCSSPSTCAACSAETRWSARMVR